MDVVFKVILFSHIFFGTISLVCFWLPVLSKKGGKLHNNSGKIYMYCMWFVVISALTLSILNVFNGRYISAGFLGYLSFLTAFPLWYAIQILKQKKTINRTFFMYRRYFASLVFGLAIVMIIWSFVLGVKNEAILLLIFGLIGLTFFKEVRQTYEQVSKQPWITVHLEGMLTTAIAAYTAFFAFGGSSVFGFIFKDQLQAIPWILPTVIGSIAISKMKKKYSKNPSST